VGITIVLIMVFTVLQVLYTSLKSSLCTCEVDTVISHFMDEETEAQNLNNVPRSHN
jgi:hypothetical protein